MKVFADLHIHSKYSRATSQNMEVGELSKFAKVKGLNLLGTGDFTHPLWFKELKERLSPLGDSGLFTHAGVYWMLTAEVSTIYEKGGKVRKIHHLIIAPSLDVVAQINEGLGKRGDLAADGRPIFNDMTSPELVELVVGVSKDCMIIPCHAWTPWFSVFGSRSGFDSMEECYEDQTKNIYALETGLSSDPLMNWRLSSLDKYALVSNSDSHSAWPWRIGREANVFEMETPDYFEMCSAIKNRDRGRFLFTIEVDPSYGKYHWDGHRKCGVRLSPKQAEKTKGICPVCRRPLTTGVLHRVEELADRPEGFVPTDAIPFKSLIPLSEIISADMGIEQLYSKSVWGVYNKLLKAFGSEFSVLLDVSEERLKHVVSDSLAKAIITVREGKLKVIPGYDGEYGKPVLGKTRKESMEKSPQKSLADFG